MTAPKPPQDPRTGQTAPLLFGELPGKERAKKTGYIRKNRERSNSRNVPCNLQTVYFCAWTAVRAAVFTISCTEQPRDRSLQGFARPWSTA